MWVSLKQEHKDLQTNFLGFHTFVKNKENQNWDANAPCLFSGMPGAPEIPLGPPGGLLGPPGKLLAPPGASWGLLGPPGGLLEASWGPPGAF